MGEAWRETVIVAVTEFGRTARINGTDGTDHGTGTVAFLAGGALRGGRVIADWPGLKDGALQPGDATKDGQEHAGRQGDFFTVVKKPSPTISISSPAFNASADTVCRSPSPWLVNSLSDV